MRTTLRTTAAALLIVALGGCENLFGGTRSVELQRDNLARHSALWANHALTEYSYRVDVVCNCLPTTASYSLLVVVSGGESTVSFYADPESAAPPVFDQFGSVERLFTIIEDAIAAKVHSRLVEYSMEYGFPTRVRVHRRDGQQLEIFVTEFQETAP